MQEHFLRRQQVEQMTGLARSTIYKKMSEGTFPAPYKLHGRAVAWSSIEIDDWIQQVKSGADLQRAA